MQHVESSQEHLSLFLSLLCVRGRERDSLLPFNKSLGFTWLDNNQSHMEQLAQAATAKKGTSVVFLWFQPMIQLASPCTLNLQYISKDIQLTCQPCTDMFWQGKAVQKANKPRSFLHGRSVYMYITLWLGICNLSECFPPSANLTLTHINVPSPCSPL